MSISAIKAISISKLTKLSVLSAFIIILNSCTLTSTRAPSNYKTKSEVAFHLFPNENLAKKDYFFELIELNQVLQKNVIFNKFDSGNIDSQKAVNEWILQLRGILPLLKEDIEFANEKLSVRIKISDFKRLDKALELIAKSNESQHVIIKKQIAVISAFNQKFKNSVDTKTQVSSAIPFELLKSQNSYAVSERRKESDLLIVPNSSFWTDRSSEKIDMFSGPGEFNVTNLKDTVCKYLKPAQGVDGRQGLRVKCFNNIELNLDFRDNRAAPLLSKIYYKLGYNVPSFHAAEELRIQWDRNIVTQISPEKKIDFDKFFAHAVLKDGKKILKSEFYKALFPNCANEPETICHLNEAVYDLSFESQIDYLVYKNIVVVKENKDHEFGSWAYGELDYDRRTEVRALLLAGAFTGNRHLRKDYNKLVWSAKNFEIKHFIYDLGSEHAGGISSDAYDPNEISWEVMRERLTRQSAGNGKTADNNSTMVIDGYKPFADHDVFSKLTFAEAQWMGRRIAGISEDELTEALAASRFSAAELLLLREKLVSLQKNIVKQLDLEDEFPRLKTRRINKKISYFPTGQNLELTLSDGKKIKVSEQNFKLMNGVLKRN